VRAAGLRGAAGPYRHAAVADRPACAPAGEWGDAAELVPAAAEGCDALVATGVMPAGVRL
jgi:hypothetical protein